MDSCVAAGVIGSGMARLLAYPNMMVDDSNEGVLYFREFYFDNPVLVNDTFYVGIRVNPNGSIGVDGIVSDYASSAHPYPDDVLVITDTGKMLLHSGFDLWGGLFPIVEPFTEDSVFADTVRGLRMERVEMGYPVFAWDTDWFREEDLFELQYAPCNSEDWVTEQTGRGTLKVYTVFDRSVWYKARVRGRRHHLCPIHDTTMWSPWSDTIMFYTGSTPPPLAALGAGPALFTLTPNPAHTEVTVEAEDITAVTLTDAAGRRVLHRDLPAAVDNVTLDIARLAAGTYTVSVATRRGTGTRQLVKE